MELSVGKSQLRRLFLTLIALAVALSLIAPAAANDAEEEPWEDGAPKTENGARSVAAARAGGKNVTISGWATFSGQEMAGKKDGDEDGGAAAEINGAEIIGSDFIYRPENEDFFFRLEVTKIPTSPAGVGVACAGVGSPFALYGLKLDIKNTSYQIRAHSIGANVTDPAGSVTGGCTHTFGLFECDEDLCQEVAALKGGYGTTGERVVVALPLKVLHDLGNKVKEGDNVRGPLAFVANAPYEFPTVSEDLFFDSVLLSNGSIEIPKKSVKVTVGKETKKADLDKGYFKVDFRRSLFKGKRTTVKTKTCLGKDCKKQTFKVKV